MISELHCISFPVASREWIREVKEDNTTEGVRTWRTEAKIWGDEEERGRMYTGVSAVLLAHELKLTTWNGRLNLKITVFWVKILNQDLLDARQDYWLLSCNLVICLYWKRTFRLLGIWNCNFWKLICLYVHLL